jgi:hypothetical protein
MVQINCSERCPTCSDLIGLHLSRAGDIDSLCYYSTCTIVLFMSLYILAMGTDNSLGFPIEIFNVPVGQQLIYSSYMGVYKYI